MQQHDSCRILFWPFYFRVQSAWHKLIVRLIGKIVFEAQESQEERRTCRTCRKLSEWRDWMMSDAFLAAMMSRVDRCSPRSLLLLTWDTIFCEVVLFVHAINVNHSESFLMNCFTISLPLFFDSNFLCCSNDFARCLYFFSWTNLTAQLTTENCCSPGSLVQPFDWPWFWWPRWFCRCENRVVFLQLPRILAGFAEWNKEVKHKALQKSIAR